MSSDGSMTGDSGMVRVMGMVVASLIGIAVFIGLTANILGKNVPDDPNDPLIRNALVQRIEPVGRVRTSADELTVATAGAEGGDASGVPVAGAPGPEMSGEELVQGACANCHAAGVANAPMLGDADAWAERRDKGYETLVTNVIEGYNAMPARGGSTYTDEEIERAVTHIAMFPEDEPTTEAAPAAEEGAPEEVAAQTDDAPEIPETAAEADAIPAEQAVTVPEVAPPAERADAIDAEATADPGDMADIDETLSADVEGAPDVADQQNDMKADESSAMAGGDTNDMDPDEATEGVVTTRQAPGVPEPEAAEAADEALLNQVDDSVEPSSDAEAVLGGPVPVAMSDKVKTAVDGVCAGCHIAGVANAPKIGDAAAWQPLADKGLAALTQSVINGVGVMPARGGSDLTDEEIPTAVQYMLSKTQP